MEEFEVVAESGFDVGVEHHVKGAKLTLDAALVALFVKDGTLKPAAPAVAQADATPAAAPVAKKRG